LAGSGEQLMMPWLGPSMATRRRTVLCASSCRIHSRAIVTPRLWATMSTSFAPVKASTARTKRRRSGTLAALVWAMRERSVWSPLTSQRSPW